MREGENRLVPLKENQASTPPRLDVVVFATLAFVRIVGIEWGLPGSEGWDNDGIAPRDFLPGLLASFTPGQYYTYPPLQPILLTIVTLPITLWGLVTAPGLTPQLLVRHFLGIPYMTAYAILARVVTVGMSLGLTWNLGRVARLAWGPRAGLWAVVITGLNVPLTYYAHTTCLDVPYLFWGSFALHELARAWIEDRPRGLRKALLFAALAIATKDQAYALFLLSIPIVVGVWIFARARATGANGAELRPLLREVGVGLTTSAAALAAIDGAIVNPSGFRARVGFLTGSASQDYVQYASTWQGIGRILRDIGASFGASYPWGLAPVCVAGIALHAIRTSGRARLAGWLPLLAALSFTLTFNALARRVEDRFVLPQMLALGLYGALALDHLHEFVATRVAPWAARAISGAVVLGCLARSLLVDAALWTDPRYDAEAWMAAHMQPGDRVETYGNSVYMPRFPAFLSVVRVGDTPPAKRSPLTGVVEELGSYVDVDQRAPRWIVVPRAWAWRYLREADDRARSGKIEPPNLERALSEPEAAVFFPALFRGDAGYRVAHVSRAPHFVERRVDINASLACPVYIFERRS